MQGGRFLRGWRLAKRSWSVLRADRTLALFPLISAAAVVAAALVVAGPGVVLFATGASEVAGVVLWALTLYAVTFAGIYCSTALAAAADRVLAGESVRVRDGFAAVRSRRGVIARWALVQTTVGVLLQAVQGALEESPLGRAAAQVIGALAGTAWAVATFFVVPLIALEGVGPKEAIKRSAGLIRERWGEGLAGSGSIGGLVVLMGVLPAVGLIALGIAAGGATAAGVALIALGVALLATAAVVGSTLNAIFRVALYRFASEDRVVGGFDRELLQTAFQPRRGRRGRI